MDDWADVSRLNLVVRVLSSDRERGESLLQSLVEERASLFLDALMRVRQEPSLGDVVEVLLNSEVHEERLVGRALGKAVGLRKEF